MRRFGIELELVAPAAGRGNPLGHAETILRGAQIDVRSVRTHLGREYGQWQVKPDGSIQPYDRGAEVVSRIMPADEASYDEVTRAVLALDTAGFGVNRTCGFHVHVSVSDLPVHVRQLIVLRYAQLQPQISAMMPPSRRANNFCEVLGTARFRELAGFIDSGRASYPAMGRYSVTNMAWIGTDQGGNARIEFRQAGGTCNAGKVIGWVRFLQEMIEDVAARAAGVTFGGRPVAPAPLRPVLMVTAPLSRMPRMRPGSDTMRAAEQIATRGAVSAAWAQQNGIGENVLRRIIVGFRRHGADLVTTRTDNGPVYSLAGARTLPLTVAQVFASATPAAAPVQAVAGGNVPSNPVPTPASVTVPATTFINYSLEAGLSPATVAWVRDRRDTFNADRDQNESAA